jgi:hypothetical protein
MHCADALLQEQQGLSHPSCIFVKGHKSIGQKSPGIIDKISSNAISSRHPALLDACS